MSVINRTSHIVPFNRDLLFLSIHEACKHRKNAVADASALTVTIIGKILTMRTERALIDRETIVQAASGILKQFDRAAYTHYLAFHPL